MSCRVFLHNLSLLFFKYKDKIIVSSLSPWSHLLKFMIIWHRVLRERMGGMRMKNMLSLHFLLYLKLLNAGKLTISFRNNLKMHRVPCTSFNILMLPWLFNMSHFWETSMPTRCKHFLHFSDFCAYLKVNIIHVIEGKPQTVSF